MEFSNKAGILVVITLQVSLSCGSHFRGGTVSWKHLNSQGNTHQIEVNYRFGWRRDWETPQCDDTSISSQAETYLTAGGGWTVSTFYSLVTNSSRSSPPISIICTAYDTFENWAYGYNSFTIEVQTLNTFYVSFGGSAWIGGLYGGGGSSWSVPSLIDLAVRSDTGRPNNPPRTFSPPIVRLLQGCPSTIQITSVDDDGDRVTCRYAGINNTLISDECGGVCNVRYPHFKLDKDTCQLHYDGGGGTFLIPVALMLEDHPSSTITINGNVPLSPSDYLSQIPLQFLVDINSTVTCNDAPSYPEETIAENETISVSDDGGILDEILYAYPSDPNAIIIQFVVLGPVGAQSSTPIYIIATGAYASNITWHPDPSQAGRHIICYYALDSLGKSGQQVCFSVEVTGLSNPCDVDNGGCNDVCLPQGGVRSCDCSLGCWNLLDNMRTCAPPVDITCDGLGVQISLPSCSSNRTIVAGSSDQFFSSASCQSKFDGANHNLRFSRHECGVTEWSNSYLLRYHADLWIWHEESEVPSIITRGEWKHIRVTCSVPTSSGSVNASFVPQLPFDSDFFPTDVTIDGMGEFSFFFEFYYSGSFSSAVAPVDYPLQVSVKDRMYFSLGAVGQGQAGLVFFTEECTASSTDTSDTSALTYTFIKDGCFLDPTLIRHGTTSNMEDRISMQAFEFEANLLQDRQNAEIFIECQVMICDASNNSTRCFQGCQPSAARKRRSTRDGNTLYRYVRDVDCDEEENENMQLTKSESELQRKSTRILLNAAETVTDSGSSREGYNVWLLFGIAHLCVVLRKLLLV